MTTTTIGLMEALASPYAGQTRPGDRRYRRRPTAEDVAPRADVPAHLREAERQKALAEAGEQQRQWDTAEGWRAQEERRIEAKLAAEQTERRRVADEVFVNEFRRRYLASDPTASEADFAADLPEIRRQHRIAAALVGAGTIASPIARGGVLS